MFHVPCYITPYTTGYTNSKQKNHSFYPIYDSFFTSVPNFPLFTFFTFAFSYLLLFLCLLYIVSIFSDLFLHSKRCVNGASLPTTLPCHNQPYIPTEYTNSYIHHYSLRIHNVHSTLHNFTTHPPCTLHNLHKTQHYILHTTPHTTLPHTPLYLRSSRNARILLASRIPDRYAPCTVPLFNTLIASLA